MDTATLIMVHVWLVLAIAFAWWAMRVERRIEAARDALERERVETPNRGNRAL